jgi:hypothetical protein
MSKEFAPDEKKTVKQVKPVDQALDKVRPVGPQAQVLHLQKQVGNQAVQRLIAQRSGEDEFELDEHTSGRINQARGGGQTLDSTVQKQMSQTMGHDFSGVRVHASPEADSLNQDLSARAFTTGQDIFFKQGEYKPASSEGQELIAHELTHVVQQSTGQVSSSGGGMRVTAAGDAYEQEADAVAKQAVSAGPEIQAKRDQSIQRQSEEEEMMLKRDDALQRQEEEEEMMLKRDDMAQRQEEEEEMMLKRDDTLQRQEEEEDPAMLKRDDKVQRAGSQDEEVL